ncbi:Rap1a/Tai family immunity protein [Luteimonas pelagia]
MRLVTAATVSVLLAWSAPAHSYKPGTLGYLIDGCRAFVQAGRGEEVTRKTFAGLTYCNGYLDGVSSGNIGWRAADPDSYASSGPGFCLPSGGTIRQLAEVSVHWADAHPEMLHEDAYSVIIGWAEAFPCP